MTTTAHPELEGLERYKFGWADPDVAGASARRGLSEEVVRDISGKKNEPEWMLDLRLKGLKFFERKPLPTWGSDLSGINFEKIKYFVRSTEKQAASWDELPADIKNTYDKLGIPEAEKQRLIAGVAAQYECIRGNSRIWTANRGQALIKEIEPGDQVFAYDEQHERFVVVPVKAAAQTDTRRTFEVVAGTRKICATDNHPVLALRNHRKSGGRRGRWVRQWLTVGELRLGDLIAVPRALPAFGQPYKLPALSARSHHRENPCRVPGESNPDLMWLLGLFAGGGNLQDSGKTHRVQFAIPATDDEVRAEIARVVTDQFGLRVIAADRYRVVVNSRALVDWFWQIGFHGNPRSRRIPEWVFGLPEDQRLAFLGGWIDADGYVAPDSSSCVALTSVSSPLLEQARDLAELCMLHTSGPHGCTKPYGRDATRVGGAFRLLISGELERLGCRNSRTLSGFGRRKCRHSFTSAHGTSLGKHVNDWIGFAPVSSVLPSTIEPVYDIEVDGPHNFIAEGLVVHNSEVVYHKIREDLEQKGVIFLDTDTALKEHPDLFQEYFATVIPVGDNKFAALNTAVWSGGSFIYVPKGVQVEIPLQAYFRINTENMGQFERTLIIADEDSYVHYVEGCLPAGELIEMADGTWRAIEQVKVGDHVLGHDGRPHRVTAFQMRDLNGRLHTLTPMSPANAFSVTDEHPVLIVRRSDAPAQRKPRNGWRPEGDSRKLITTPPQWVAAKDVREGDFLVFPKPRPRAAPTRLPLAFARLAGYYLAVGSATLTNGDTSLAFSFHIDETAEVDEVRRACKELYDAEGSVLYNEARHEARVLVYTKAGYHVMKQHIGDRSYAKTLSGDLVGQDEAFLRELLDAYVRGDGNEIMRGGGSWRSVHTTSRKLAFQLQSVLARLGSFATVELHRNGGPAQNMGREEVRNDLYQVQWTEGRHDPKQARDAGEYFLVPVRSRTVRETSEPVFNLDVEEPDSYLACGFAVHNCTAPIYSSDSLHSAVVEIIVKKGARCRYTTIQNWSSNVYNLVTKRAVAQEGATMEWIDGNIGSKVTMKYPAVYLMGEHAKGETLSVAFAGIGQHQDAGAKMVHCAPNTSSTIVSKSVARAGGRTSYRGLVEVREGAEHSKSTVKCDALLIDTVSRSDTYPYVDVREDDVEMGHEATVSKVSEDQLFYLMSRGMTEDEAMATIVRGFVEPIARELPMEYAPELNRLIELQMEGAVG